MAASPDVPAEMDAPSPQADTTPSRSEAGLAFLLALATSLAYLAIAQAHGALGASRGDDWAFYRIAYRLAEEGGFELNGWSEMMFVGQALLAWPIVKLFGAEIAPLQLMVAVLSAVGLWAAYLLVRAFLPLGWSVLAVGCLALGPVLGSLSVSFMTDVPAFSFQMLCLLAGQRALRSKTPSTVWFIVSLALALAAFSIREYGVAAGLAVSLVVLSRAWSVDRRLARQFAALAFAGLIVTVAMFLWRRGLQHSTPTELSLSLSPSDVSEEVSKLSRVALTLALFVSPALLIVSPIRLMRAVRTRIPVIAVFVVLVGLVVAARGRLELLGNYFTLTGSYSITLPGPAPQIVPSLAWSLLRCLGFVSLVALALLATVTLSEKLRRPSGADSQFNPESRLRLPALAQPAALVGVFTASTAAIAVIVILTTTAPFFDRYLIALVPFVAALVIRAAADKQLLVRKTGVAATASLAVLSIVGLTFVDASATFDGGKWQLAGSVENLGFESATIDGGFEWFGYHQSDPTDPRPELEGRNFWVTLFSDRPICAMSTHQTPYIQRLPGAEVDPEVIGRLTARSIMGIDYPLTAVTGPQACNRTAASSEP